MTSPVARNRLDEEESPYLRDHADNPVHWQPWDDEALAAATDADKPIFLSVGYAACHWCHVMADESFEDDGVAETLNENFVPIKVDREERPDVDSIYQTICQQVSGRGGWPLSVWLTPEGKPFQVGTYFPKEPQRGMPGFRELLEDIAEAWNDPDQREEIESRAEQWSRAVTNELEGVPDEHDTPDTDMIEKAAKAAVRGADYEHGGWGSGPKFPQTGRLHILFRAYERTGRDEFLDVCEYTLDGMANGGMYDQIGGGFHRYATDNDWTVPHFEKMLYDNAELPRAYLAGYQLTDNDRYAQVARETLEFVERELTHEDGGFFSTLDAQSENEAGEREEGAYYVWTPAEIADVLDNEETVDLVCDRFGITESGNFEGSTVLTRAQPIADLAETYEMDREDVQQTLDDARDALAAAREERSRPPRDEKILASWNGLMLSAFAEAAIVLDSSLSDPAEDALAFVREHLWDAEESRLQRRYKDGVTKIDGYLEDYAFLGRGALNLYEATRDVEHLQFALELGEAIEAHFWDEEQETLYFTPQDGEELIARPQELTDQSTPSSAGVAAELLDMLDHFRTDDTFGDIAMAAIETQGTKIRGNPLQHASLTLAADTVTNGALELALVTDEVPADWRAELSSRYFGSRLMAWRPPDEDTFDAWLHTLGLDDPPPIWEDRLQTDDEPTVFACRSRTCSPPRHDMERTLNWADGML
jgi:uncharacterized protein YyaL (SSP411 family)